MAHPGIKESGSLGRRTTNFAQRLENSLATPKAEYDKGQAYVHQVDAELTLLRKTMLPHQRGDPDASGRRQAFTG